MDWRFVDNGVIYRGGIPYALRADAPPFVVPAWTDEAQRLAILDQLTELGERDPVLRDRAQRLAGEALRRTRERRPGARTPDFFVLGQVILEYVQAGGYREDRSGDENYQGPVFTLEFSGNCNDAAVLFAALARLVGMPAETFWLTQREFDGARAAEERRDHVTAGVRLNGHEVCWAEGTLEGARFCENPYRALRRLRARAANLGL